MTNNIYTYIFDNFNIKVTDYTFKRDYIQNPLKWGEKPHKDDITYLYLRCNLMLVEVSDILKKSKGYIANYIKSVGIKKSIQQHQQNVIRTLQAKYGVDNPSKSPIIQQRREKTFIKRYGTKSYIDTEEFDEKTKQTNLEKYGVEKYIQTNEYRQKICQTNKMRYGYECYFQSKQFLDNWNDVEYRNNIMNKRYNTQKKNGTLGKSISKEELKIFETLKTRFSNVVSQYYSEKYPWKCDFYIPEIDLYIEYNGFWMHGKEPFIGTNKQKEIVKLWESKANECKNNGSHNQYKMAIDTWTKRDTKKRQTAKQNNLNYLEFFNINEFNRWFYGYKNVY